MTLLPADYAIGGVVLIFAILGLFRGLSGTLAFFVAAILSGGVGFFGWRFSANYLQALWARGVATLVAALLMFGLSRLIVKKSVNGLLAQPSDAIFGFLVGLLIPFLILLAWAYSGFYIEYSSLVTALAQILKSIA